MSFLYNQNQMRRSFLMPQPQQQMQQQMPQVGAPPQQQPIPQPSAPQPTSGIPSAPMMRPASALGVSQSKEVSKDTAKIAQETTPFFKSLYESMRNIDPEQRESYLQNAMSSIKDRLDRYEFRLARGIPLSAAQQEQYNALRSSFNDIQNYVNNPSAYDQYFQTIGDPKASQQYRMPGSVPGTARYV